MYAYEDTAGEDILFLGGSYGNIKEDLWSNYKYKNNSLKNKDPVNDWYKSTHIKLYIYSYMNQIHFLACIKVWLWYEDTHMDQIS